MATGVQDALSPQAFGAPGDVFRALDAGAAATLLAYAGDVALILDAEGRILDSAISSAALAADGAAGWRGHKLAELVTIESVPKIRALIADAAAGKPPRWRQVTHPMNSGELPARYICVATGDRFILIGRDLREAGAAQQRLIQVQQTLERDYLRLRQAESRYRLLFDMSDAAVLVVDTDTRRVVEANPAAHRLLGVAPGALMRQPAADLAADHDREPLIAFLGAAGTGAAEPVMIKLATGMAARVSATPFRQERATYLLVSIIAANVEVAQDAGHALLADAVERMPDAFVLTDRGLSVVAANAAFAELAHAPSQHSLIGQTLNDWLGRPGVDLELIAAELKKQGVVRSIATILRGPNGVTEEVELSGVATADHFAFVIRGVARRMRDLPPATRGLPRSVEQLTELVGRMSLKDIVRESTDLIERLCIEAALAYTSDNRASAAEILGLSRQGLYSKLHRHGLGNLVDDDKD